MPRTGTPAFRPGHDRETVSRLADGQFGHHWWRGGGAGVRFPATQCSPAPSQVIGHGARHTTTCRLAATRAGQGTSTRRAGSSLCRQTLAGERRSTRQARLRRIQNHPLLAPGADPTSAALVRKEAGCRLSLRELGGGRRGRVQLWRWCGPAQSSRRTAGTVTLRRVRRPSGP
jgi:hypothetical protein